MQASAEKVHDLKADPRKLTDQEAEEIKAKTNSDLGKVALFVSLLTVILLVVFFFGLNQNVTGLTEEVRDIPGIKERIATMDSRIEGMETDLAALKDLPQESRRMVLRTMLQDMAQRAGYLTQQVDNEEQSAKLNQAMQLLEEVQTDLGN